MTHILPIERTLCADTVSMSVVMGILTHVCTVLHPGLKDTCGHILCSALNPSVA